MPGYNFFKSKIQELSSNDSLCLVIFSFIILIGLPLIFYTIYQTPYSSIGLYNDFSARLIEGNIPYRDFTFEYPPFSLLFFLLPQLLTASIDNYQIVFQLQVFLFILLGLFLLYRIGKLQGRPVLGMFVVYTLAILASGPIIIQSYDIFPAILLLLSCYLFMANKHVFSWMVLAMASLTKVFPLFIAPVFLVYYLKTREYKRILSGIGVFAITSFAILIPFLAISPGSLFNLIDYHTQRGIQIESIYSSCVLFADKIGLIEANLEFYAGSWHLTGSVAEALATASTFLMLIALLFSYWLIYNRIVPGKSLVYETGTYLLLVISIVFVTSKILSPQYLIWILPLLPLLLSNTRYFIWIFFLVAGGATFYIFPLSYLDLIDLSPFVVMVLVLRNALLLALTALIAAELLYRRWTEP